MSYGQIEPLLFQQCFAASGKWFLARSGFDPAAIVLLSDKNDQAGTARLWSRRPQKGAAHWRRPLVLGENVRHLCEAIDDREDQLNAEVVRHEHSHYSRSGGERDRFESNHFRSFPLIHGSDRKSGLGPLRRIGKIISGLFHTKAGCPATRLLLRVLFLAKPSAMMSIPNRLIRKNTAKTVTMHGTRTASIGLWLYSESEAAIPSPPRVRFGKLGGVIHSRSHREESGCR